MAEFFYKGFDGGGAAVSGSVEAGDRKDAIAEISRRRHLVTELREGVVKGSCEDSMSGGVVERLGEFFSAEMVSGKDILGCTNQLCAALRAGLPLLDGLKIIYNQQHKKVMRRIFGDLVLKVSGGASFSEALAEQKVRGNRVFSDLYVSMVRVGETSGMLDETMSELVGILGREEKIKTSMKNASAYPLFVLVLGIVSVVVIVTWILPKILMTLVGSDVILPLPTRMLLGISEFVKIYGIFVLLAMVGGGIVFGKWKNGGGRMAWDVFKLRVPVLGGVLRSIAVGRFARTLGAMTKGGVSILESLRVVKGALGNEVLSREIEEVTEKVKGGATLAEPLENSGYFPPLLIQIVSVGEQTGALDELLLNAADTFDEEADSAINRFMAVFPALLILILAVIVAFIILATLLPIFTMSSGIG